MKKDILFLRKEIDRIDKEIIKNLEKRIKIAQKILALKEKYTLPFTDKKREKEIVDKLKSFVDNRILKDSLGDIYKLIFSLSKKNFLLQKNKSINFKKIAIIGLGLIGGSIAKAIKFIDPSVEIYSLKRKDKDITLALKEKIINRTFYLDELVDKTELIIIATPIETIIPIAEKIANLYQGANQKIIIDVGSVKEKIVKKFEKLNKNNLDFIGTHPMAGSEKAGFENSRADLFLNYPWLITPHKLNKKENIEKIKELIKNLGSIPILTNAKNHDLITARVSHLVFLLSKLLFIYVYEKNKNWIKFAGTGFKTTTRLTSSNPLMHSQIFINNYQNIQKELRFFAQFLKKIKIYPENSFEIFKKYKQIRDKLFEINS